jgi:hypothetical protein
MLMIAPARFFVKLADRGAQGLFVIHVVVLSSEIAPTVVFDILPKQKLLFSVLYSIQKHTGTVIRIG